MCASFGVGRIGSGHPVDPLTSSRHVGGCLLAFRHARTIFNCGDELPSDGPSVQLCATLDVSGDYAWSEIGRSIARRQTGMQQMVSIARDRRSRMPTGTVRAERSSPSTQRPDAGSADDCGVRAPSQAVLCTRSRDAYGLEHRALRSALAPRNWLPDTWRRSSTDACRSKSTALLMPRRAVRELRPTASRSSSPAEPGRNRL